MSVEISSFNDLPPIVLYENYNEYISEMHVPAVRIKEEPLDTIEITQSGAFVVCYRITRIYLLVTRILICSDLFWLRKLMYFVSNNYYY
jgi:hypothetical protein